MNQFECKRNPDVMVTEKTCLSRQAAIRKKTKGYGAKRSFDPKNIEFCINCTTGLDIVGKKEIAKMENFKTCARCHGFKPADLENFDRAARSQDGLTEECSECRDKTIVTKTPPPPSVKPKPKAKPSHQKIKELTTIKKIKKEIKTKPSPEKIKELVNMKIVLDLTKDPELMKKIKEWAKDERRTSHDQILYHLEKVVFGEMPYMHTIPEKLAS